MGSANINDRSQKVSTLFLELLARLTERPQGDGDSEIALVVEDEDLIETTMNGQLYHAGRFAATLRRRLWRGIVTRFFIFAISCFFARASRANGASELPRA